MLLKLEVSKHDDAFLLLLDILNQVHNCVTKLRLSCLNENNEGESVAILLALVGAVPVKEGTGRVVRYDLLPLEEIGRPRIDILASMSGIFRCVFYALMFIFFASSSIVIPSNLI